MAVLLITVFMIFASGLMFAVWHLANEMGEPRVEERVENPPPLPPHPPTPEPPAREITPDQWEGLVQVWRSIRERFDRDPNAAVLYADLVISDLILDIDGIDGPPSHNRQAPCNFGSLQVKSSYREAHQITATRQLRPLSPAELQHAMTLYISVFNEIFDRIEQVQHHN